MGPEWGQTGFLFGLHSYFLRPLVPIHPAKKSSFLNTDHSGSRNPTSLVHVFSGPHIMYRKCTGHTWLLSTPILFWASCIHKWYFTHRLSLLHLQHYKSGSGSTMEYTLRFIWVALWCDSINWIQLPYSCLSYTPVNIWLQCLPRCLSTW